MSANRKHGAPFEDSFMPEPNSGCWLWMDGALKSGYGAFYYRGKSRRAHRVSYEMYCEAIPFGMSVLHRCDVPLCVNPSHLFIGTQKDNIRDMDGKGRRVTSTRTGEANSFAKLTEADALAIRSEAGSIRSIARKYGVGSSTVFRVKHGISWKAER